MPSDKSGAGNAEPNVDWDALARYLAGESSATERASVEQWLGSQPADARLVSSMDDVLQGLTLGTAGTEGIDVEAALAKVNRRRALESVPVAMARKTRPPYEFNWVRLAAAAAVVIAAGTMVWRIPSMIEGPTIAARTFTTPVGGRDSLLLPDGSSVVLGPGTSLTLAAGYGQRTREVSLRGEALFDVKHDDARPFVVTASGATIRDIGTAFVVHSDSAGGVRVSVTSGSVEVSRSATADSPHAVLHAGDVGTVPMSGEIVADRGAVRPDDLAWTRDTLVFRETPLTEVRDDLRRWYGIELTVRDSSVWSRHVTATFLRTQPVQSVLDVIKLQFGATIERRGDTALVRIPESSRRR